MLPFFVIVPSFAVKKGHYDSAHGRCEGKRVIMHLEVQCRQQDKKGHYALSTTVQPIKKGSLCTPCIEKRVIMHSEHGKCLQKKGHYALRSAVQVARQKGSLCTLCIGKRVIMHFDYG